MTAVAPGRATPPFLAPVVPGWVTPRPPVAGVALGTALAVPELEPLGFAWGLELATLLGASLKEVVLYPGWGAAE